MLCFHYRPVDTNMECFQPCDVSVIIAVYNQSAHLELLLNFLGQQDYTGEWEIIVCDDGSHVDMLSVIKASASNRRVRYVWQSRNGEARAMSRNNALRCANGNILILMDGDLAVPPDFVSRHVRCHADGKRRIVCGARKWVFLEDLPRGPSLAATLAALLASQTGMSLLYTEVSYQKKYANSPYPWFSCYSCNLSYSRGDGPPLFNEAFTGWGGEDLEFACRLHLQHGYEISLEPELIGLHLEHGHRRLFGVRPESHDQIVQFLRNIMYFCDSYPQFDMSSEFESIGLFELDTASNSWRRTPKAKFSREHIHSTFALAQRWLTDSGLRLAPQARRLSDSP
jgi:glycosyltransferase involved in cell wall biosynthesis